MSVKVRVFYPQLQSLFDEPDDIRVVGETVGECLDDLIACYPEARDLLFNRNGELLRHVHVLVNHESIAKVQLTTPIRSQDQLIIAVLVSGG